MGGILFRLQAGPRTLANAMPKPPACIIGPRYAAANPAGRFLVVRSGGKWGGLFWATSLEKIFRGVIAIISFPQEDGCSGLPCRGVLSFRSEAREASV